MVGSGQLRGYKSRLVDEMPLNAVKAADRKGSEVLECGRGKVEVPFLARRAAIRERDGNGLALV